MELRVNGKLISANPDAQIIARSLRDLTGEGDSFAILSKDKMSYIQTSGSPLEGFILEYQDGSLDQHFQCLSESLDLEKVTKAFAFYLQEDQKLKTDFTWEKIDLTDGFSARKIVIAIAAIFLILIIILLWKLTF